MENLWDKVKTWFKANWRRFARRVLLLVYTALVAILVRDFCGVVTAWVIWRIVEVVLNQIKKNSAAKPI